jgi:subtilisin family serine protease
VKNTYIVLRDQNRPRGRRSRPVERDVASGSIVDVEEVFRDTARTPIPPQSLPDPAVHIVEVDPAHAAQLALDEDADAVAREMPVAAIEPNDAGGPASSDGPEGTTWGITAIGADKSRFSGTSAKVAVLDSGIERNHAAFQSPDVTIAGEDFTDTGDIADQTGHGTHCLSTIIGRDVQGHRIGVAPGVRTVFLGRIFAPGVTTKTSMVVRALEWAVGKGANVISMSLAFNFTGLSAELQKSGLPAEAATAQALIEFQNNLRLFDRLLEMYRAKEDFPDELGVVIVGAAGNHSHRESTAGEPTFSVPVAAPSNASGIISVGALRRTKSGLGISPSSNSMPMLVAPGFEILGADSKGSGNDSLIAKNGTSMACPHVAGLAALWWDAIRDNDSVVKAQTVISSLRASCKRDLLSPGLNVIDRGLGIPQAP